MRGGGQRLRLLAGQHLLPAPRQDVQKQGGTTPPQPLHIGRLLRKLDAAGFGHVGQTGYFGFEMRKLAFEVLLTAHLLLQLGDGGVIVKIRETADGIIGIGIHGGLLHKLYYNYITSSLDCQ